ncbi:MAG: DegT/DnrJ/EryC1/StrS family aminotransferase [Proteobacteria bacterium]|nr:DegT/DnrJ/EryC1/StrS family aminotransferase [Pseudomonadota bacterium]
MQFVDLAAQQKIIRDKIETRIKKVLDHGTYINGPEVRELEETLARYVDVKHAVGVSSGTDALLMPLMAYGIGPGDAVFTTTFTFIATGEVIQLLRATPVFVDIDPGTFNLDAGGLEEEIKKTLREGKLNPRAIIPVDLFGQPADYDEIGSIAKKYNLFVLEDAAQSFGATYKGRKTCALADVAATSFFPAKPFGCYGDGGMIFTNDSSLYESLISIRVHGQGTDKYDNIRIGINGRLDTMQAAIMLAKFEVFNDEVTARQKVAMRYSRLLKDAVQVPLVKEYNQSVWAQYSVRHHERDKLIKNLQNNKIPTAIYYPRPLHLQKAFHSLRYKQGDFPASEKISREIFSLPIHPYLSEADQEKIAQIISSHS